MPTMLTGGEEPRLSLTRDICIFIAARPPDQTEERRGGCFQKAAGCLQQGRKREAGSCKTEH